MLTKSKCEKCGQTSESVSKMPFIEEKIWCKECIDERIHAGCCEKCKTVHPGCLSCSICSCHWARFDNEEENRKLIGSIRFLLFIEKEDCRKRIKNLEYQKRLLK